MEPISLDVGSAGDIANLSATEPFNNSPALDRYGDGRTRGGESCLILRRKSYGRRARIEQCESGAGGILVRFYGHDLLAGNVEVRVERNRERRRRRRG